MQYVFINNSLETYTRDGSGAIATHIAAVRAAARRDGIEPVVVTRESSGRPALDAGPTYDVPAAPVPPRAALRGLRKACRLRGWQGYDERWHAWQVRLALPAVSRAGRRTLVLHNDPDVADYLAHRFSDDVVIHVWHNELPHGRSRHPRVRHLAVSHYLAEAVCELAGTVPDVVPNGVDADVFHPAESGGAGLTVSFLGRTGIEKGPDLLLRALLDLPQPLLPERLLLIGSNSWGAVIEDPYQRVLAGLVEQLEARGTSVERTGHLGRDQVAPALRRSDVHVVPSRWQDPAPLVLLEAMATGLATVAARSGGMPEYGGDAVLWFDRDDVEALSGQLTRVLGDAALRRDLGRSARIRAEELTWDRSWRAVREAAEP